LRKFPNTIENVRKLSNTSENVRKLSNTSENVRRRERSQIQQRFGKNLLKQVRNEKVIKYNRQCDALRQIMRKFAEPKRKSVRRYKVQERMCERVLK
jgi:hypothetical protein